MMAASVCGHVLNLDAMDPHFAIIGCFFLHFCATINAMQTPQKVLPDFCTSFSWAGDASIGDSTTLDIRPLNIVVNIWDDHGWLGSLERNSSKLFLTISLRMRCVGSWKCSFLSFGYEGDWSEHLRWWGLLCWDKPLPAISSLLPFPSAACFPCHCLDQCLSLMVSLFQPPS